MAGICLNMLEELRAGEDEMEGISERQYYANFMPMLTTPKTMKNRMANRMKCQQWLIFSMNLIYLCITVVYR